MNFNNINYLKKAVPDRIIIAQSGTENKELKYIIPPNSNFNKTSTSILVNMNFDGTVVGRCGSMCSGKSKWLIGELYKFERAKRKVLGLKPKLDNRSDNIKTRSISNNKDFYQSKEIEYDNKNGFCDIIDYIITNKITVVGIDELQFLENCDSLCWVLKSIGITTFVTFLDGNINQEPFENINNIPSILNELKKLRALCYECPYSNYREAPYTIKKGGTDSEIEIGDKQYYAVCYKCLIDIQLGNRELTEKESLI